MYPRNKRGFCLHSSSGKLGGLHDDAVGNAQRPLEMGASTENFPALLRPQREAAQTAAWEAQYKIPVFTAPQNQIHGLKALGVRNIFGVTYFPDDMNKVYAKYFTDAGFNVTAMRQLDLKGHAGHEPFGRDVDPVEDVGPAVRVHGSCDLTEYLTHALPNLPPNRRYRKLHRGRTRFRAGVRARPERQRGPRELRR